MRLDLRLGFSGYQRDEPLGQGLDLFPEKVAVRVELAPHVSNTDFELVGRLVLLFSIRQKLANVFEVSLYLV